MEKFNIYINNQECEASEGERVLTVAHRNGIFIPALCYHCDLSPHESCRFCMVEVEGDKNLRASCDLIATAGMRVQSETEELKRLLAINLELVFAQHRGKCDDCLKKDDCKLREAASRMNFEDRFKNRKTGLPKYQFGPSILFDPQKCINCENCSEMCAKQTNGGFLRPREDKYNFEVAPSCDKDVDCIYCGQCVVHCPVGALSEVEDFEKVYQLLKNQKKKVVFQFAPAIRTSLGEEFGMELGTNTTNKIFASFQKIGAFKGFDTGFAADLTIMEESQELVEKILKKKPGVLLSSCCPGWVKYLEFYEKGLIGHLAEARSPQIMQGGVIKTYWAKNNKINPKEIVVVSIMPCTAKKFEITRPELYVDGMPPVDFVLTTREYAKLLKKMDVDFANLDEDLSEKDIIGDTTGAGEIFGASGGVLEAAIRTAYYKITGKNIETLEFKELREYEGTKILELEVTGVKLKVAAVNGIENVKKIIYELKNDPSAYDYVEVMACPGGCIGGGGQPLQINDEIRRKRSEGLYQSDRDRKIRYSHENPGIKVIYKEFLNVHKNQKKICHTSYKQKMKGKVLSSK